MKYRSKPEFVDAVQWNRLGDHPEVSQSVAKSVYVINLSSGQTFIRPGDYILTHSDGSLSVMSKEEFERKYEKITYDCPECDGAGTLLESNEDSAIPPRRSDVYLKCETCNGTGEVEE